MTPSLIQITPRDPELLNDPNHWRAKAQVARSQAETMKDEVAKKTMEGVIGTYERLALAAEGKLAH